MHFDRCVVHSDKNVVQTLNFKIKPKFKLLQENEMTDGIGTPLYHYIGSEIQYNDIGSTLKTLKGNITDF